jgi:hypothetical protein
MHFPRIKSTKNHETLEEEEKLIVKFICMVQKATKNIYTNVLKNSCFVNNQF